MTTTIHERVARVANFLVDDFAGGNNSISCDDVMDEATGLLLKDEIDAILALHPNGGTGSKATDLAIAALSEISGVWESGYELASGEDWVTDNETVADILTSYTERAEALKP